MAEDFGPNEMFSFAGVHPSTSPVDPSAACDDADAHGEDLGAWIRRRPVAAVCAALAGGIFSGALFRSKRHSAEHGDAAAGEPACPPAPVRVEVRRVPIFFEFPPSAPPPDIRPRSSRIASFALSKFDTVMRTSVQGVLASAIAGRIHEQEQSAPPEVRPAQRPGERRERAADEKPTTARKAAIPTDKSWWALLKTTFNDWTEDKAPRLGAALAYYTVFSIAPLLVIVMGILGMFQVDAEGAIRTQLQSLLGTEGAEAVQALLKSARSPEGGAIATTVGIIALLFGASGVFGQLKDAMNTIWEVEPKPGRGIWGIIKDRFLSFAMVLGIGFLLLVSLVISASLMAAESFVGNILPGPDIVAHVLNVAVSLLVITLLFAMIFKLLPDVQIAWKDVWLGAFVTAVLFTIGKVLIGLYLGQAAVASAYGAAGSVIIVLLWAYYSSQILFFGAEFTQAYARMYGSRIVPSADAEPVTAEARAQQGLGRA